MTSVMKPSSESTHFKTLKVRQQAPSLPLPWDNGILVEVAKVHTQGKVVLQRTDSDDSLMLKAYAHSKGEVSHFTLAQLNKIYFALRKKTEEELCTLGFMFAESSKEEFQGTLALNSISKMIIELLGDRVSISPFELGTVIDTKYRSIESPLSLEKLAMLVLIDFLRKPPAIERVDFAVIEEDVQILNIETLINAIKKGHLPYLNEMAFSKSQLRKDKALFDQLNALNSSHGIDVYVQDHDRDGNRADININHIDFAMLG